MKPEQIKTILNHPIAKAFAEGKIIEYFTGLEWVTIKDLVVDNLVNNPQNYRIKEQKIPEPPVGEKWHNPSNLNAETIGIADGWRLLLVGEVIPKHYQYFYDTNGEWCKTTSFSGEITGDYNSTTTMRTLEPLPSKENLSFEDVPAGSLIRTKGSKNWSQVTAVTESGVGSFLMSYTWSQMREQLEIKRPGEEWLPCEKQGFVAKPC